MGVDDPGQIDLAGLDLAAQNRRHSVSPSAVAVPLDKRREARRWDPVTVCGGGTVLVWMCGVDDDGLARLIIHDQVGVVVTLALPLRATSRKPDVSSIRVGD